MNQISKMKYNSAVYNIYKLLNKRLYITVFIVWGLAFAWSPFLFAAQPPQKIWQRNFNTGNNDYSLAIAGDTHGNIYITGYYYSSTNNIATVKYNTNGDTVWESFFDAGDSEQGQGIAVDDTGNVYVCGNRYNGPNCDFLLIKYDPYGDTVWQRFYDAGGAEDAYGVCVDRSGNIFITGSCSGVYSSGNDYLTIKYNSSGDTVWQKFYDNSGYSDWGYAVTADDTGFIYVTGYSWNISNSDYFTIKYDTDGNTIWTRRYDNGNMDDGHDVEVDRSGNVYVMGQSRKATNYDYFVIKYNSGGDSIWQARYDSGNSSDVGWGVAVDSFSCVYVTGYCYNGLNDDFRTVKYGQDGNTLWVKIENLNGDYGFDVVTDDSGNVFIGGYTNYFGDNDFIIIKYWQNPASQFNITSLPFTVQTGVMSPMITVEAQNDSGTKETSFSDTAYVLSSSGTGKFSISNTSWSDMNSVTFSSGSVSFYYKDSVSGNPVITVMRSGFISGSQQETITIPTASEFMSYTKIKSSSQRASGSSTGNSITVFVNDITGAPLNSRTVFLTPTRGNSTSLSTNPQITDSNGMCTWTVSSTLGGMETFTASCDGKTLFKGFYSGAVLILPFDDAAALTGTLSDISGYNNNAKRTGGTPVSEGQLFGTALSFNGTTDTVTVASTSSLNTNNLTIMMWVKPAQLRAQGIADKTNVSAAWRLHMSDAAGHIEFDAINDSYNIASSKTLEADTWAHIAATYNFATRDMKIYINGSADGVLQGVTNIGNSTANTMQLAPFTANKFNGCMDEVKIYNRALSDNEIWLEYGSGAEMFFTATNFAFTTPQRSVMAGLPSDSMAVEAWGTGGGKDISFEDTAVLKSSSPTGKFSVSQTSWVDATIISFLGGGAVFYYKDTQSINPIISVSRAGINTASQTVVVMASVSETTSYFRLYPLLYGTCPADAASRCTVSIFINNEIGSPVQGKTITLYTSRGASDTVYYPFGQVTDGSGQCTAVVVSGIAGDDTFSVFCDSVLIRENILDNPSFETGSSQPDGWTYRNLTGTWSWDPVTVYSGLRSITHYTTTQSDNYVEAKWNGAPDTNTWPIARNTSFYASIYCRTNFTVGTAGVKVSWYGDTGFISETMPISIGSGQPWTFMQFYARSPSQANAIMFRCQNNGGNGTMWFDSARLQRSPTVNFTAIKFRITTQPKTIGASIVSDSISVEAKGAEGGTDPTFSETVVLQTSSAGGRFSVSNTLWADTTVITMAAGARVFYYMDSLAGNPVITVSRPGLLPDSQMETINGPVRLKIKTSPFSAPIYCASPLITAEVHTNTGVKDINYFGTVTLSTSSNSGSFSLSNITWSSITVISLASGSASFYYKDTQEGSPVITVDRQGLLPDTQVISIIPLMVSETVSYLRLHPLLYGTTPADGSSACTLTVTICNELGYFIEGKQITINTSRGSSFDTIYFPFGNITDSNGQCTALITSFYAGEDTIAALCDGCIITENVLNNPSFEMGEPASEWTFMANTGIWSTVSDVSYSGYKSIKHTTLAAVENYAVPQWPGMPYTDKWPLSLNSTFFGSGYIKTDLTSDSAYLKAYWYNNVASMGDAVLGTHLNGANSWTYVSGSGTAQASANGLVLRCQNEGMGTVWFDALRIRRVPTLNFVAIRFDIYTPARTVATGSISEAIGVEALGASGGIDITMDQSVFLYSSSIGGLFSASNTPWTDITDIPLVNGSIVFYYKDTIQGNPVITVFRSGFPLETQTVNVINTNVSDTTSFVSLDPGYVSADGIASCTVAVHVLDSLGVPLNGLSVTIMTSRGSPTDTVIQPVSPTDTSGMSAGTVRSALAGTTTITVFCEGRTIQCSPYTPLSFIRPVLNVSKSIRLVRTGETGTILPMNLGDTLEYTIRTANTGNESATNVIILDTRSFDTATNNPVIFMGMDTVPADSWAYTTALNPSDTDWIADVPSQGAEDVKGLRWVFGYLPPGASPQVRFVIKVK